MTSMNLKSLFAQIKPQEWITWRGEGTARQYYSAQQIIDSHFPDDPIFDLVFWVAFNPNRTSVIIKHPKMQDGAGEITLRHCSTLIEYPIEDRIKIMSLAATTARLDEAWIQDFETDARKVARYCREYVAPMALHEREPYNQRTDDEQKFTEIFVSTYTAAYVNAVCERLNFIASIAS